MYYKLKQVHYMENDKLIIQIEDNFSSNYQTILENTKCSHIIIKDDNYCKEIILHNG